MGDKQKKYFQDLHDEGASRYFYSRKVKTILNISSRNNEPCYLYILIPAGSRVCLSGVVCLWYVFLQMKQCMVTETLN